MELSLSANALKTFARSATCLARVGNELAIQASPSLLALHTLNSSRSAYQSITLKPRFFDVYTVIDNQVECSELLKAVCSVLRTPIASVDHLRIKLLEPDASESAVDVGVFQWRRFPSSLVVRPQDLNRLLANFQSSLQEITMIATEPNSLPSDAASEIGGKAVELRSYLDPTKDNVSSLHTQLWIDPTEEFLQYTHTWDPVDVTFGVQELKAFLSLCEGCEVHIHLYFEKAGEPILMVPKFGLDNGSSSNFDATLVLATMLVSQLHDHPPEPAQAATTTHAQADKGTGSQAQGRPGANISEHPSNHTKIWFDLSGSANRNSNGTEGRQVQEERNLGATGQREVTRLSAMHTSMAAPDTENEPMISYICHMEKVHVEEPQGRSEINGHDISQRHCSNWVDANEDDEEDDDGEENELCVQSTPPYNEEH